MRPAGFLVLLLTVAVVVDGGLAWHAANLHGRAREFDAVLRNCTAVLGLSDLCITNEARYTRHPAASDRVVPFMDHPGALEHFPSGSFFAPPATEK